MMMPKMTTITMMICLNIELFVLIALLPAPLPRSLLNLDLSFRVMHGREAFEPGSKRLLSGCYVASEYLHSQHRVLFPTPVSSPFAIKMIEI